MCTPSDVKTKMAQCKLSPQEFIKDAFTPQIAAMCTPGVQKCCDKNNLEFIELLEPFSTLTSDGKFLYTFNIHLYA